MLKINPDFMQVRPYGNIGDRKCDGLLFGNGTVFQVYSPDEMKQSETLNKIDEDLAGALEHWNDSLKRWVFVYNVIRGVPPDIPRHLKTKGVQYPNVEIDHMSNDGLWELIRELDPQKRAELLGAPPSYENIFALSENTLSNAGEDNESNQHWIVLVQDTLIPIDIQNVLRALHPNIPFGAPYMIRPESTSWAESIEYQRNLISSLFEKCRQSFPPRFAIFSVAPIPFAIHLGFLLTESVQTKYFKLHKDTQSWSWPEEIIADDDFHIEVTGLPTQTFNEKCDVVIRISVSAVIHPFETKEVVSDTPIQIDLKVKGPNLLWLRSPEQVKHLGDVFRGILLNLRDFVPRCEVIHLFFAGPTACAVIIGQQINPRMYPPVNVYYYSRQQTPRYRLSTILKEGMEL